MKRITAVFLCLVLILFSAGCGKENERMSEFPDSSSGEELPSQSEEEPSSEEAPAEEKWLFQPEGLFTDSEAFCVLSEDGSIFTGNNIHETFAPASTTKVLTALVAAEHLDLDRVVTVQEEAISTHMEAASSGITPSFKAGEKVTVRDLLYALILPSTNAAANILAYETSDSVESFVDLMNEKAKSLGTKDSHFADAHGLDMEDHYASAYDMALVLKAAMENEEVAPILGAKSYTIPATEQTGARTFYMTHRLVSGEYFVEGVIGGKPGVTHKARYALLTAVRRNNRTFYICTLHSDEHQQNEDTKRIIEFCYAKLNGKAIPNAPFVHDLEVISSSEEGLNVQYTIRNTAVSSRIVYWNQDSGTSGAKEFNNSYLTGTHVLQFKFPGEGKYCFQIFVKDQTGAEQVAVESVLYNKQLSKDQIISWNGNRYYINERGFLESEGAITFNGDVYYVGVQGELLNGFVGRFFADSEGKLITGWLSYGGKKYYFQGDGRMAKGKMQIGGVMYEFSENGELISGE